MDPLVAFLMGLCPGLALLLWQWRARRPMGPELSAGSDPSVQAPRSAGPCEGPVSDPMVDGPAENRAPLEPVQPPPGRMTDSIRQESLEEQDDVVSAERMLASAGAEMSETVNAIESRAQLLLDAIGDAAAMPTRAEGLWLAMRRARSLCRKVQCFAGHDQSNPRIRATAVAPVIERLRHDLAKDTDDGLRVSLRVAETLPLALCDEAQLYDALRFAVDALLAIEPEAETLSVALQNTFNEDSGPLVIVELQVPLRGDGNNSRYAKERLELGYAAALNLIKEQGAYLSFSQQPGAGATILISLPATIAAPRGSDTLGPLETLEPTEAPQPDPVPADPFPADRSLEPELEQDPADALPTHAFGGVLVLEDQPAVRSLISNEVRALHRNVFACPNGSAARSLIQATPERFELWIAEIEGEDSARHRLALETLQLHPDLKLLSLTNGMVEPLTWPEELQSRVAELSKPFGARELRGQIRRMLG